MKKRVSQFMQGSPCPLCEGKRLTRAALSVTFAGLDIGALSQPSLTQLAEVLRPVAAGQDDETVGGKAPGGPTHRRGLLERVSTLTELGLGYLALERSTPTLSSGELQRLRLATQLGSQLFGVIYVLDEPSAGLHPADGEALFAALERLKAAGNSLFVVEHDLETMRRADWLIDVGPAAGEWRASAVQRPPAGWPRSRNRRPAPTCLPSGQRRPRATPAQGWLKLEGVRATTSRAWTWISAGLLYGGDRVSGSGKSSLVSQALLELVGRPRRSAGQRRRAEPGRRRAADQRRAHQRRAGAHPRLVQVDQKPIGRTRAPIWRPTPGCSTTCANCSPPRRRRKTRLRRRAVLLQRRQGPLPHCEGEGFVSVELLFMPSVYAPCPTCHGARYNPETLAIKWQGLSIAQVLGLTVEQAVEVFAEQPGVLRSLQVLRDIGLGYLRLASRRPNSPAAKRNASSSPPSCNAMPVAPPCTCWTNPPPACIHGMSTACSASSITWWTRATRWSWWNMKCAWWPRAIG
jgi:excinuclease ABC subunit A